MKALDAPLLADENIQGEVVAVLRKRGLDVVTVDEMGLRGQDDQAVIAAAFATGRVVLTHDADFGMLAILRGSPVIGILYLRHGHIRPSYVLGMLDTLASADIDVDPPFIVVVQRRDDDVRVRFRTLRNLTT